MKAIIQGTEVLYLVSDMAEILGHQITDGGVTTTMGEPGPFTVVTGVTLPDGTVPFICHYDGTTVSVDSAKQAAYTARQQAIAIAAGQAAYLQALASGVVVTSTGTPSLSGTYTVPVPNGPEANIAAQANVTAVETSIAAGRGLPGGGATFDYHDASGAAHAFDATAWGNFATALMNYSYSLQSWALGGFQGDPPSNQITIA